MTAVLVDGFGLSDGSQFRGIGTFLHELIKGLVQERLAVRVLAPPSIRLPQGAEHASIRRFAPARFQGFEHDWLLPRALSRHDASVFHSPAQQPPRRSPIPWVQTLHDVIPLTRPHPILARDRDRWLRLAPRIREASAVAADSRFSADEGIRHLGLDRARVHVIPLGVDPATFHPGDVAGDGTSRPYLLHVGSWGPHKGHAEAVAVHALLCDLGYPHRLTMAGHQDAWMLEQVQRTVATSPRSDRIEVVGYTSDLAELYRGASALLGTSRSEGFGLPAVEAMACGTPVVAFRNSAVSEVVADGGVLVADGDIEALVQSVRLLLDDESTRDEWSAAALARSRSFRWDRTARAYADLFHAVSP